MTREEKRIQRANNVCRELRYQLSNHSNWEPEILMEHLLQWMKVAKKDKYVRPEKPKS